MNVIRKIIKENINSLFEEEQKKYINRFQNQELSLECLKEYINEDDEEIDNKNKQDVLRKLEIGDFDNDPQDFKQAISKSNRSEMLTDYSLSDLSKMKLFKVNGYDIGFALKKHGNSYSEIVSVFNNEPEIKGIGKDLLRTAIDNGGCYLDHFDGFLSNLYGSLGFEEIARDKYNPEYDENNIIKNKYGEVDVIYRKYKGCSI